MTASSTIVTASSLTTVTPTNLPKYDAHVYMAQWLGLGSSGIGAPLGGGADNSVGSGGQALGLVNFDNMATYADKTVQFSGDFSSATLTSASLIGSNDGGHNWFTLKDIYGNAVTASSAALIQLSSCPEQISVVTPGGDSNTAINCYLYMRKAIL